MATTGRLACNGVARIVSPEPGVLTIHRILLNGLLALPARSGYPNRNATAVSCAATVYRVDAGGLEPAAHRGPDPSRRLPAAHPPATLADRRPDEPHPTMSAASASTAAVLMIGRYLSGCNQPNYDRLHRLSTSKRVLI